MFRLDEGRSDAKFKVYTEPCEGGRLDVVVDAMGLHLAPSVAFVPSPPAPVQLSRRFTAILGLACAIGAAVGTIGGALLSRGAP